MYCVGGNDLHSAPVVTSEYPLFSEDYDKSRYPRCRSQPNWSKSKMTPLGKLRPATVGSTVASFGEDASSTAESALFDRLYLMFFIVV